MNSLPSYVKKPQRLVPMFVHFISRFCTDRRRIAILLALLIPIAIPVIHMQIFSVLWAQYNRKIDKKTCSNSCWDTVFKGNYEAGIGAYKHVYFNATAQSAKIWISTVVFVIACYESTKYLFSLVLNRKVRFSMFVLFSSVVYAHYYSYWSYFNYYNDDFYSQFYHQLFFTFTELTSTVIVLHLANSDNEMSPRQLLIILAIAITHIFVSGWDQFVTNVIKSEGQLHQVLRDVFFMVPDLLHVFVPLYEFRKLSVSKRTPATHLISNEDFLGFVLTVFFLSGICMLL